MTITESSAGGSMSLLARARRPFVLRVSAMGAVAILLLTTALANSASAHGNVVDPPSRNYGCYERWGSKFQAPEMATEDPMCYQAWQADPNAMWNWNGLFREGVKGDHQGAIPDGQLCSGGRTQAPRYNSLDAVGDWKAKSVGNNFSVKLFDQASHGADYIRVYVTKQGFNPITQPLGWGNLELVKEIPNTPAAQWDKADGGVSITVPATAAGRTGRHIVYTIWQASHLDQSYYFCSDVNFGGSTPTTSPSASPTKSASASPSASQTSRPPTSAPPTSPPVTTPPPGTGACSAAYSVTSQWQGGFQGSVSVTAGSAAIKGWTLTWTYANGQQITSSWNVTLTSSGSTVTARNAAYNGSLGAGASATFGFLGSWSGTNPAPAVSCSAT
jgi:predicted carbohydrate-binding protein with CBM5 and CBM33 domain